MHSVGAIYQLACTYYDALRRDDDAYICARAIQFFAPGIPQVYYVGLLAGGNDMALLRETGIGRDINRRRFAPGEAEAALARPVVRELLRLIRLRNESPAFDGCFRSRTVAEHGLALEWTNGPHAARLSVDLRSRAYAIDLVDDGAASSFRFDLDASGSAPPAARVGRCGSRPTSSAARAGSRMRPARIATSIAMPRRAAC